MEDKRIDEVYDKVINMDPTKDPEENKLTDEEIDLIADEIEKISKDELMEEAKKQAAESTEEDKAQVAVANIDPIYGSFNGIDEIDLDDTNIKSFEELLDSKGVNLSDMDIDKLIAKFAIATFFAIDNDKEVMEKNGITDEVTETVIALAEKYRSYQKIGKKFSYYNSMPAPIQKLIVLYHGTTAMMGVGGNMTREARNFIASSLLQSVIDCNLGDFIADDLNRSIVKMGKELEHDVWSEPRKYFYEELPSLIVALEEDGKEENAKTGRRVLRSYEESWSHELLIEAIKGKLKIRPIDLEKFEKTCESFNDMYRDNTYAITDVSQAFAALCRSKSFNEDAELYKKVICYFIAYTKKYHLDPNDIVSHTYMYYFIQNIITLDYYNPANEDDVKAHDEMVEAMNKLFAVIKKK